MKHSEQWVIAIVIGLFGFVGAFALMIKIIPVPTHQELGSSPTPTLQGEVLDVVDVAAVQPATTEMATAEAPPPQVVQVEKSDEVIALRKREVLDALRDREENMHVIYADVGTPEYIKKPDYDPNPPPPQISREVVEHTNEYSSGGHYQGVLPTPHTSNGPAHTRRHRRLKYTPTYDYYPPMYLNGFSSGIGPVHVDDYYRGDGTHVQSHFRSHPH